MNFSGDIMGERWCVAITAPRAERIAKMQAEELGISCFLPLREKPPTTELPVRVEPCWPGYLFVQTTHLPDRVRAARRVISTADGRAVFVPEGIVERLMGQADRDGIIEKYQAPTIPPVRAGCTVRLLYGSMAGQFAVVEEVRRSRVRLKLSCENGFSGIYAKLEQIAAVPDLGDARQAERPAARENLLAAK